MLEHRNTQNRFIRTIKKFFYSAFVVITFIAYALENRGTDAGSINPATSGVIPAPTETTTTSAGIPTNAADGTSTSTAAVAPTAAATATGSATTGSGYQDGTYTGSSVDIRWGYIQVQATIQGGKITNVQVPQYPNERRTSLRINSNAIPELQQEAIQAQSANVNIITGATLTSEGFQQSLQAALTQAKG